MLRRQPTPELWPCLRWDPQTRIHRSAHRRRQHYPQTGPNRRVGIYSDRQIAKSRTVPDPGDKTAVGAATLRAATTTVRTDLFRARRQLGATAAKRLRLRAASRLSRFDLGACAPPISHISHDRTMASRGAGAGLHSCSRVAAGAAGARSISISISVRLPAVRLASRRSTHDSS